jgi:hypothetical protein
VTTISTFGSSVVAPWSSTPGPFVPGSMDSEPPPPPRFGVGLSDSDWVTAVVPFGRLAGPVFAGSEGLPGEPTVDSVPVDVEPPEEDPPPDDSVPVDVEPPDDVAPDEVELPFDDDPPPDELSGTLGEDPLPDELSGTLEAVAVVGAGFEADTVNERHVPS